MKTIKYLFLLVLFASASTVYAQRVLTDEERQTLLTSATFLQKCHWAINNQATYWGRDHDGSGDLDSNGTPDQRADRIVWAKNNTYSTYIIDHGISDPRVALTFLLLSKSQTFTLGSAPQNEAALLAVWTDGIYETYAIGYFALKVSTITDIR